MLLFQLDGHSGEHDFEVFALLSPMGPQNRTAPQGLPQVQFPLLEHPPGRAASGAACEAAKIIPLFA